jgi:hypothetical protein
MAKQQDSGGAILPVILIGGAAYLAYQWFFAPATSAAQASATPAPSGTTPQPPATPTVAFNTPDQIYQRLAQNLQQNAPAFKSNPNAQLTPEQFLYFLNQVTQLPTQPNFSQMFPQNVNPDGTSNQQNPTVTLGQFWSVMAPWISKNVPGVQGAGLAGYILSRRRA